MTQERRTDKHKIQICCIEGQDLRTPLIMTPTDLNIDFIGNII